MNQDILINPNAVSLSNLLRRGFATAFDLLLLSPALFAWWYKFPSTVYVFWEYSSAAGYPVTQVIFFQPLYALPLLGIVILYFGFLEGWFGATPGKFLLREMVLTLRGERIAFSKSFARNLFKPLDFVVGIIFFLVSRRNQTLGDLVAGTVVVRKNTAGPPIEGTEVSSTRKLSALVLAIIVILIGFFLALLALKIREVDRSAFAVLQKAKETRSTGNLSELYHVFSPQFRDEILLEEFIDSFNEPELQALLKALEVDKVKFYDWEFSQNRAALLGETKDRNIVVEISLAKNEKRVWEPYFLWIY